MVDGKQRPAAEAGFDTVLACFEGLPCPAYHLVGNHDLYNLPRPRLNERCVADVVVGGLALCTSRLPVGSATANALTRLCTPYTFFSQTQAGHRACGPLWRLLLLLQPRPRAARHRAGRL